ncbi:MAG: hypothetical protein JWN85_560 [Gammaproteobacteria bacterium]|nr:hypothetical protein [Gammaproteobacteria bacterium]
MAPIEHLGGMRIAARVTQHQLAIPLCAIDFDCTRTAPTLHIPPAAGRPAPNPSPHLCI